MLCLERGQNPDLWIVELAREGVLGGRNSEGQVLKKCRCGREPAAGLGGWKAGE